MANLTNLERERTVETNLIVKHKLYKLNGIVYSNSNKTGLQTKYTNISVYVKIIDIMQENKLYFLCDEAGKDLGWCEGSKLQIIYD